eukprot:TRINITY_DN344_c0_g1_i4.p1 TRINITY_DN344_c0_g1~~TRINITY_DN344_c0_g1_i4.p1  ORF type:complete len:157 (+),score=8.14 TRINITY_DN344_c0_g1_i4:411-881(+)
MVINIIIFYLGINIHYATTMGSLISSWVKDMEDETIDWFDQFYPVITEPIYYGLPVPALYEYINRLKNGHSDGYQFKRLMIVLGNAAVGYGAYKAGSITGSLFNTYLIAGTGFYAVEHAIVGGGSKNKPTPDLDPCGNPIVRNPDGGGHSGGGGAC